MILVVLYHAKVVFTERFLGIDVCFYLGICDQRTDRAGNFEIWNVRLSQISSQFVQLCPIKLSGKLIYSDDNHLSVTGAALLYQPILEALNNN